MGLVMKILRFLAIITCSQAVGKCPGRVTAFLLSSLKHTTREGYMKEISIFSSELAQRGLEWFALPEEQLDWILADYIVECHDASDSATGISRASALVAALSKVNPRHRYRVSWKVLDTWRNRYPPKQAPSMPQDLALAIVSYLTVCEEFAVAGAILQCFSALLRISEALALTTATLVRGANSYFCVLGRTKRGMEQNVEVTSSSVVEWLDRYLAHVAPQPGSKVFKASYPRINRWLRKAAAALYESEIVWTTHSLRRGGATALLMQGIGLKEIMLYGRWLNERSCREYLRRGEVGMSKLSQAQSMTDAARKRVELLASLGAMAFGHSQDKVVTLQDC